jgi:hypothetical protein
MATPPQIDIVASKRVPFDDIIAEMLVDYSDATPLMELRTLPGAQGDPVESFGVSVAGAEGIEITYDEDYTDPDPDSPTYGEDIGASIIRIIIDEATLEALSYAAKPEQRAEYYYDIHLDPDGSAKKFVFCRGKFIVDPGVTL